MVAKLREGSYECSIFVLYMYNVYVYVYVVIIM